MALSVSVAGSLALKIGGATPLGASGLNLQLVGSGGTAPYSFRTAGELPPGLSLSTDGRLSGQPSASGSALVRVLMTDSGSPQLFVVADVSLVIS